MNRPIVFIFLVLSLAPQAGTNLDPMWINLDFAPPYYKPLKTSTSTTSTTTTTWTPLTSTASTAPYPYQVVKHIKYNLSEQDLKLVEFCFYSESVADCAEWCNWMEAEVAPHEHSLYFAALRQEFGRFAIKEYDIKMQLERCFDRGLFGVEEECKQVLVLAFLGQNVIPNRVPSKREEAVYKYFVKYAEEVSTAIPDEYFPTETEPEEPEPEYEDSA